MIAYLSPIYHDEILYSWLARNHYLRGTSLRQTSIDFFSKREFHQTLLYHTSLDIFVNKVPHIDINALNSNHTLTPIYKPFVNANMHEGMPKEFNYVYKHDPDWIKYNVPYKNTKYKTKVDVDLWHLRDQEFEFQLRSLHEQLIIEDTKKITKTMLLRKTGREATIEKNLDKLPQCKIFLDGIK